MLSDAGGAEHAQVEARAPDADPEAQRLLRALLTQHARQA